MLMCVALSVGCAGTVGQPPDQFAYDMEVPIGPQFDRIDLADGIDAREADLLASLYFQRHVGSCGANFPAIKKGNRWHAETLAGPAGHPQPEITVHAKTGVVRMKGEPVSKPPWDDLREWVRIVERMEQRIGLPLKKL